MVFCAGTLKGRLGSICATISTGGLTHEQDMLEHIIPLAIKG